MLSIGGITYTDAWNQALAANADPCSASDAAALATQLGVGIEIDYEQNTQPQPRRAAGVHRRLPLGASLRRHRRQPRGARLTIDLAAGDRWLIDIGRKATADWLRTDAPGARLRQRDGPGRQPSASTARSPTGRSTSTASRSTARPIPPLAPGQVHRRALHRRGQPACAPECTNFAASLQKATGDLRADGGAQRRRHDARACSATCSGRPSGPPPAASARTPPNTCEGGIGVGRNDLRHPHPDAGRCGNSDRRSAASSITAASPGPLPGSAGALPAAPRVDTRSGSRTWTRSWDASGKSAPPPPSGRH